MVTARNRAIDRIRRDRTLIAKTQLLEVPEAVEDTLDAVSYTHLTLPTICSV